jgi:hypothetical protein
LSNKLILVSNELIKVGIAIGTYTWGEGDLLSTFGGTFTNNTLKSGPNGYFGIGSAYLSLLIFSCDSMELG